MSAVGIFSPSTVNLVELIPPLRKLQPFRCPKLNDNCGARDTNLIRTLSESPSEIRADTVDPNVDMYSPPRPNVIWRHLSGYQWAPMANPCPRDGRVEVTIPRLDAMTGLCP